MFESGLSIGRRIHIRLARMINSNVSAIEGWLDLARMTLPPCSGYSPTPSLRRMGASSLALAKDPTLRRCLQQSPLLMCNRHQRYAPNCLAAVIKKTDHGRITTRISDEPRHAPLSYAPGSDFHGRVGNRTHTEPTTHSGVGRAQKKISSPGAPLGAW